MTTRLKPSVQVISDKMSETYIAEGENESIAIYHVYDRVKYESLISIEWSYFDYLPQSLLKIIEQEVSDKKPFVEKEAKKILKKAGFSKLDFESKTVFIYDFNDEANIFMKLAFEARTFDELVATIVTACTVKELSGELEEIAFRGEIPYYQDYSYIRHYLKNRLRGVLNRYRMKYVKGVYETYERISGKSLLKLSSKSRTVIKIVTFPYQDGWINFTIRHESAKTRSKKESFTYVDIPSGETIQIPPKNEQEFISTFSSLKSLQEAKSLIEMLDLIASTRHHDYTFNGNPENNLKEIINEYLNVLEKYPNILKKKDFYKEYPEKVASAIQRRIHNWKNIAVMIEKYCGRSDLQRYLCTVALLAIEANDQKILKEVLPHLPREHYMLIKTKLIAKHTSP